MLHHGFGRGMGDGLIGTASSLSSAPQNSPPALPAGASPQRMRGVARPRASQLFDIVKSECVRPDGLAATPVRAGRSGEAGRADRAAPPACRQAGCARCCPVTTSLTARRLGHVRKQRSFGSAFLAGPWPHPMGGAERRCRLPSSPLGEPVRPRAKPLGIDEERESSVIRVSGGCLGAERR